MNTILLTGFDPFGQETINPSWEAVRQLDGEQVEDYIIRAVQLPTSFRRSAATLRAAMQQHKPDAVICVGQAGGRPDITLERVAVNVIDARIPDNDKEQPIDVPVVPNGPAAYWTTLPVKTIRSALHEQGIPSSISYTAGTFVCNAIFYELMHETAAWDRSCAAGFVHIPFLPEQAASYPNSPSMSLSSVVTALRTLVKHVHALEDHTQSAGTLHGA
ncbi:pyroglutamyl-peptidase I [Paenibacillus sp. 481]|uniref:pyroglutamyl-peptidase I n=1 Tax=Paenibacillus sp. 481 TaxID=2835869 RepID=UPI001E6345E4|nr:pyroglutamyl-peptidase I [Paenibacillus sp. 481]UHA74261.1 pyroglutamyl-peptidase I [Paenibacillus sp. 481]